MTDVRTERVIRAIFEEHSNEGSWEEIAKAAIEAYEAAPQPVSHPMLENAWEFRGLDANEIIEACACVVDQCNREGPYQAIAAASRIRALKAAPQSAPVPKDKP